MLILTGPGHSRYNLFPKLIKWLFHEEIVFKIIVISEILFHIVNGIIISK